MNLQVLLQKITLRRVMIGLIALTGVILVFIFLTRPITDSYQSLATPLRSDQDYSILNDSKIYVYNGLYFSSVDITTQKVSVLSKGGRLPTPSNIYWANDDGALVTFESSFSRTPVAEKIEAMGDALDDVSRNYLWYIDFNSGEIKFVDQLPPIPKTVTYSAKDKGLYYVRDISYVESETPDAVAINFFSLTDQSITTFSNTLRGTDVSSLSPCQDAAQVVCIVLRKTNEPSTRQLYEVKKNKTRLLHEQDGTIIATNNPSFYLISTHQYGEDSEEEVSLELDEAPVSLLDITTHKTSDLGFTTSTQTPLTNFYDNKFYSLLTSVDQNSEPRYYAGGKNILNNFGTTNTTIESADQPFEQQLIDIASYGSRGITLVSNLDGEQFIVGPKDASIRFPKSNASKARKTMSTCSSQTGIDYDFFETSNVYRIYIPDNQTFKAKTADFRDCIAGENPHDFLGVRFQVAGVSPVNGRITTD